MAASARRKVANETSTRRDLGSMAWRLRRNAAWPYSETMIERPQSCHERPR
jgi:hypothetical protein